MVLKNFPCFFLQLGSSASRAGIYMALKQHLRTEIQSIPSCHNGVSEHQALVLNVVLYASAKQFRSYL